MEFSSEESVGQHINTTRVEVPILSSTEIILPHEAAVKIRTTVHNQPKLTLTQQSKPVYSAVFRKDLEASLVRCGIHTKYVNPVPIGVGANHVVFYYSEPGLPEKVVKLGKSLTIVSMTYGKDEEQENFRIAQRHFKSYPAAAEVRIDPQNPSFFCVIQELVHGTPLTNKLIKENADIQRQLKEIVHYNNELYRQEKMSLDFVGMSGFSSWLKSQFTKLLFRKSEFQVSNILVDSNNILKIVDLEYFKFKNHISLGKRLLNLIGFSVNRILMKHYFGLDIKKV